MNEIFVQVHTTAPSAELADQIAKALVEAGMAACVQISGPIRSVYRWEEKIQMDQEWSLSIKTKLSSFQQIEALIKEHHTYEVPEIIAIDITDTSDDYGDWLRKSIS